MTVVDPGLHHGELLTVAERMIVAPVAGRFQPTAGAPGSRISEGDTIGVIEGPGASSPVESRFSGVLMEVFAQPGERLREAERVAWVRVP
jgi:biotin carboxyl carrier protein